MEKPNRVSIQRGSENRCVSVKHAGTREGELRGTEAKVKGSRVKDEKTTFVVVGGGEGVRRQGEWKGRRETKM